MPRIFISYRRADSAGWVTAIYKELIEHFDPQDIFRDITTIDYGVDFVETIEQAVQQCDVLLAIIGPQWQTITDQSGKRRLENPNDFVRLEIVTALNRNVRVIPVLVGGATMPYENEIPDDLRALCRRNALEIGDRDFDHHMQQLIGVLQRGQSPQKSTPASKSTVTGVEDILPPPFEWIEIPAGVVVLEDASQGHDKPGTKGGHFPIPTFAIAKYPITNSQYHAFVEDGYGNPKWWDFSMEGKKWREEHAKPQPTAFDGDDLPRTNVSWYDAVAFCRWLSSKTTQKISLPTEQQWLRAAQGDDNRKYPWGEKRPNELLCNWAKKVGHPTPVMQYPQGISPFGVMDMSGNVWEWCLTEWGTDSTTLQGNTGRLLKGGCWYHELTYLFRAAERTPYAPNLAIDIIGFRIARTL